MAKWFSVAWWQAAVLNRAWTSGQFYLHALCLCVGGRLEKEQLENNEGGREEVEEVG